MKIFKRIIALVLGAVLLFWVGSVLAVSYLTAIHADEFADYKAMKKMDYMHPWNDPPNIRVLSYGEQYADVYFYDENGGEKIRFTRQQDGWVYSKTLAIWSKHGSADDYLIWPYFKNYGF